VLGGDVRPVAGREYLGVLRQARCGVRVAVGLVPATAAAKTSFTERELSPVTPRALQRRVLGLKRSATVKTAPYKLAL
jgi:hypothetical protein